MLSQEICEKIWTCHREIAAGNELLNEVEKVIEENKLSRIDATEKGLKDVFGQEKVLQLGVPSGGSSHRLFSVSYELSVPVIKAHIANKQAELAELNEMAKLQLGLQEEASQ